MLKSAFQILILFCPMLLKMTTQMRRALTILHIGVLKSSSAPEATSTATASRRTSATPWTTPSTETSSSTTTTSSTTTSASTTASTTSLCLSPKTSSHYCQISITCTKLTKYHVNHATTQNRYHQLCSKA